MDDKDNDIKVVKFFNSDVFIGVSVEMEIYNIDFLQQFFGVKCVWRNYFILLIVLMFDFLLDDVVVRNYMLYNIIGVSKFYVRGYFGKGVKIGVVDIGMVWDYFVVGLFLYLIMRNIWSVFY